MTTPPARQTFRETVAQVAEKARARLPQAVNGRIESAVQLVLLQDVRPRMTAVSSSAAGAIR